MSMALFKIFYNINKGILLNTMYPRSTIIQTESSTIRLRRSRFYAATNAISSF